MKTAILQVADTGPLESLVVMLRSVGYDCYLPDNTLHHVLKGLGGLVLTVKDLVDGMGYEAPFGLPLASDREMRRADLFVDVKAHQTYPKIINVWPNLKNKALWYRINGGKPEHVVRKCDACHGSGVTVNHKLLRPITGKCIPCMGTGIKEDCGDEVNPPCPVLTPNQWYKEWAFWPETSMGTWENKSYTCWPPFYRFSEYYEKHGRARGAGYVPYSDPRCLIHNIGGWGYRALIDNVRLLGVKCYGRGSPDGLIPHRLVPEMLSTALAYVHLKSSDAPGYALYEAMAAACPIICTRRLIWRCKMQDLLIPNETCLVFDRETHDPLSQEDVHDCTEEIKYHLIRLKDPEYNRQIGMNGHERLKQIMWSEKRHSDVESLKQFMARNFGE